MIDSTAAARVNAESIDRGIPSLTTKKKKNNITRLVIIGAMLVALVLLAFGAAIFMERLKQRKLDANAAKAKERPQQAVVVTKDFEAAKKRIKAEDDAKLPPPASATAAMAAGAPGAAAAAPSTPAAAVPVNGTPGGAAGAASGSGGATGGGGYAGQGQGRAPVETVAQRRLASDVLVPLGGDGAGQLAATPDRSGAEPLAVRERGEPKNGLDEKLRPSRLLSGVAAQVPDLNLLLPRGRVIDCGQKTSIVSTHPGFVSCVVAKDVYSANGAALLIERGSEAFGESREPLKLGQESLPVLWTTIRTPRGVVVDINSLATDALGASGIPAYVDNHTGQRFGGAVMLSLISDIGQALANSAGSGSGTIRLTTTATAGQDLAAKTLESTINIPPTGYSLQGSAIKIFVARDMDFRSVYELAKY